MKKFLNRPLFLKSLPYDVQQFADKYDHFVNQASQMAVRGFHYLQTMSQGRLFN
jgi:hypothetical protein